MSSYPFCYTNNLTCWSSIVFIELITLLFCVLFCGTQLSILLTLLLDSRKCLSINFILKTTSPRIKPYVRMFLWWSLVSSWGSLCLLSANLEAPNHLPRRSSRTICKGRIPNVNFSLAYCPGRSSWQDNMQGKNSKCELFQNFKQVQNYLYIRIFCQKWWQPFLDLSIDLCPFARFMSFLFDFLHKDAKS